MMDNEGIELLILAGKLSKYSDNEVLVLKTNQLAEILDAANALPDEPIADVIRLPDKLQSD